MKAMLLAAGRGERMGELTAATPKPLLRIGRETLIERQLRRLADSGIREVVINLSWLGSRIRAALGDGSRYGVEIAWSEEGEPALETAGGIVHALPLLGAKPFVVVNSDVVTDFDFSRLVRLTDADRGAADTSLGTLVLVPNPPHHSEGDFGIDAAGRVVSDGRRLTYAGIALLHPELFAGCAPGRAPLRPVFEAAVRARRLAALRYDGLWIDVGTPARLAEACSLLEQRHSARALGHGAPEA